MVFVLLHRNSKRYRHTETGSLYSLTSIIHFNLSSKTNWESRESSTSAESQGFETGDEEVCREGSASPNVLSQFDLNDDADSNGSDNPSSSGEGEAPEKAATKNIYKKSIFKVIVFIYFSPFGS